ncbi:MAG: hypothetical protein C0177_00480 [Fervidicoccus fontis]|nr:MAG: hypothetical protein C0177_00480 [Fervidicoccus fontis]
MESQTQVLKEDRIGQKFTRGYKLVLKDKVPFVQFYDGEMLIEEIDLYEVIKEIDKLMGQKFTKEEFRCEYEDIEQLNRCISELWAKMLINLNTFRKSWRVQVLTFVPLNGGDFYEKVERIYTACYNGRRYDVYAWRGWYFAEVGLDWHLVIVPHLDEWCEAYCGDRFCP